MKVRSSPLDLSPKRTKLVVVEGESGETGGEAAIKRLPFPRDAGAAKRPFPNPVAIRVEELPTPN